MRVTPVLGSQDLVMGHLMGRLAAHGDRTALIMGDTEVSYGALAERSNRLANALLDLGIRPGERLAFAFPNGPDIVCCYLACAKSGIVGVPLAQRLTNEEVRFELSDSGAVALVCPAEWAGRMLPDRAGVPELRAVICERPIGDALVRSELEAAASPEPPVVELRPEDPFCVMYTGGTTGTSKAAIQTQQSWAACIETVVEVWGLRAEDRHLIVLPMTHVAWFTAASYLHAGASVIIAPRWDPAAVLRAVGEQGITHLNMIPTMLGDLLTAAEQAAEPPDLRTLRLLTVAGSSMPLEMFRRAQRAFGPIIGNIYGMTESSGPVTYLLPEDMREETILSGGRPGRYVELAIFDEHDRPVSGTQPGEICFRGPQMMGGYLNRDDETAAALAGGWFHTGDIGYVDEDGFVYVVDRKKDMIKSGGFNVYPKEVEETLYRHPDVIEAAVIGLPDPRWIEAVHAVVVLRRGAAVPSEALIDHCRSELAAHKVPKAVHLADELPRTPVGKFDKRALRRRYAPTPAVGV